MQRGERYWLTVATGLSTTFAVFMAPPAWGAEARFSEPLPVAFRGTAWQEAVAQVASRLGATYTLERSTASETLSRPVRFAADYLTGDQVLRWLARLGGVTVVSVGEQWVFGKAEAWPAAWRVRAGGAWSGSDGPDGSLGLTQIRSLRADDRSDQVDRVNRADVEWVDQTPSAAAADIRAKYRIDVIVDPAILSREELLTIVRKQLSLSDLLAEMARTWKAIWAYEDGAIVLGSRQWVGGLVGPRAVDAALPGRVDRGPRPSQELRVGGPLPVGGSGRTGLGGRDRMPHPRWWAGWVRVDTKERSWKKALWPMMQLMGAAATWRADQIPRLRIAGSAVQADGKTGEVLEGLELLGYLHWQRPGADASVDTVEIWLQ
jgi:hypothetical protein